MTLGALTGTGGMVALDGVGLESWGKGQTHKELRAQHVVFKETRKREKSVGGRGVGGGVEGETVNYKGACANSLAHTLEDRSSQA